MLTSSESSHLDDLSGRGKSAAQRRRDWGPKVVPWVTPLLTGLFLYFYIGATMASF